MMTRLVSGWGFRACARLRQLDGDLVVRSGAWGTIVRARVPKGGGSNGKPLGPTGDKPRTVDHHTPSRLRADAIRDALEERPQP